LPVALCFAVPGGFPAPRSDGRDYLESRHAQALGGSHFRRAGIAGAYGGSGRMPRLLALRAPFSGTEFGFIAVFSAARPPGRDVSRPGPGARFSETAKGQARVGRRAVPGRYLAPAGFSRSVV
jgi:hypothetical protein